MTTTLILTSTVNVNLRKECVFQTDVNSRIETYLKSVLQWLKNTNFNIVLVENSGYKFDELYNEKEIYKNRFEVITFMESELEEAAFLKNNDSKGNSEVFAINYVYRNSKLIKSSNFIIKITARFYIDELEEYLSQFDLDKYDCLTQNNRDRCEMIGSHYKNFSYIFNIYLVDDAYRYDRCIERIWKFRTLKYKNVLVCKSFKIEKTQRGGVNRCYDDM